VAARAEPTLAGEFPPATRDEWLAGVDRVLKGGSFERLVSRTADDIEVQPLYTDGPDESVTGTPGAAPFTRGFTAEQRAGGMWDIRTVIIEADPAEANRVALRELERGSTSLLLAGGVLTHKSNLAGTLDGVLLDLAPVVLQAGSEFAETAAWLMELWMVHEVADADAKGGFGADPVATLAVTGVLEQGIDRALADLAGLASMTAGRYPGVRAVTIDATPWAEAGASEGQELAAMLSTGAAYLRAMQGAGMSADAAAGQIEIVLGASADFFTTMAKVRAARRVWTAMADACGIDSSVAAPRITVRTLERIMSRRDPWVNMLRVTSASFGAVLGGADSVIALPFDVEVGEPQELGRRMARNTQLLLGEESGVGRVVDPAGGSWYVETLTESLAGAAWELFRVLEGAGGMPAVLLDGTLATRIATVSDEHFADVARRVLPLTGVSEFPNLGESPLDTPPWPVTATPSGGGVPSLPDGATTCSPLRRVRWPEQFEALRDAADAEFADRTEPVVFLANLGPVATHTARASFAKNLFEAGGLVAASSETGRTLGFESAESAAADFAGSGAFLACICSSDGRYAEQAAEVAGALKAAGATRVYLAGKPGDLRDELVSAGVDDFVAVGSDVLAVLRSAHEALGIDQVSATPAEGAGR